MIKVVSIVERGKQKGRTMDFPTINMVTNELLEPGLYVSKFLYKKSYYNKWVNCISNVSEHNNGNFYIETHALNMKLNEMYGDVIDLFLLEKVRIYLSSSNLLIVVSIQPKQIASSINSLCDGEDLPVCFL